MADARQSWLWGRCSDNYITTYLKGLFSKGSFASNVLTISMGIAAGQAIAMAAAPVITRLYAPADFGVLEVFVSLLGIFVVAASLKYEGAIPLPKSDITAANVFVLCMVALTVMTALVGFLTWFFADKFLALVKAQVLRPYIWLLPLAVLGAGTYQVLNFWGIRQKAFSTIAWTKISQNFGRASTMIGLGWIGLGPLGLLVGEIIGHCSGSTRLAISTWRKDRHSFKHIEVKRGLEVLKRYRKFPFFTMGANLLHTFGTKAPYLLLAATYGLKTVGWFALAQWIIGTPIGLIGSSVSQVYMGELAHLNRHSPAESEKLFFNTLKMLSLTALAMVPLIIIVAPLLVPLLFGEDWRETGVYIQVLSFMFAFMLISYPLLGTLDYLNRQGWGMIRESLRVVLVGGSITLAAALKQPAVIAILFYGIASGIVYIFGLALSWYAIKMHSASLGKTSASNSNLEL